MLAAAGLTETLANAAKPWADLYSDSKAISAGVLFLHLAPLVFGAGAAYSMDRATISAVRASGAERAQHLRLLSTTHRIVVAGLALSVISGVLLFLADVETFMGSIFYWVKISLVVVLLANGYLMTRTESALAKSPDDAALWGRLRTLAIVSAVLWLATTLAGVVLAQYA
ncbi:MAG: hypothetical protein ABIY52_01830 [Gemmatimonadaceae bacterium]